MENERGSTSNQFESSHEKYQHQLEVSSKETPWLNGSQCGLDSSSQHRRATGSRKENLFIGGMSCSTNLSELQQYLRSMTGTSSGLFISMVSRIKRKSFSGYGIIKNVDPQTAEYLLQIKNFKFQGCWYGIKPFLKKKSEISKARLERAIKKVYLNGLREDIKEHDLETYFSKYGQVLHVQISKHLGTLRYKGFGFVEFGTSESAKLALDIHRHAIKGHTILCQETNNPKKGGDPFTKKSTISSKEESDKRIETTFVGSQPRLVESAQNIYFGKQLPNLLKMCLQVAQNHNSDNIAFRVRLFD